MPELPIEDVIIQFAVVIAAALAVQLIFDRTRIPGIIGLLILGMLLGPGGAGVLAEGSVIELLGSIGLLFIMFMAGVEIDLDIVRERKYESASFGLLAFALTFIPAFGVGRLMGLETPGALLIGAALSSHTLVSYPQVHKFGLARHRPIIAATGGTLLTDTAALVVLVVVTQVANDDGGMLGWATPLVLLAILAAAALVLVPRLAGSLIRSPINPFPQKALLVLVILLVLAVLADVVGTERILGAFLAGVCLNRPLHRHDELRRHVEFVGRMLFIPFFFVETGMRLELAVFVEGARPALFAAALTIIVIAGKGLAAWLTGWKFGYSRMDRIAMAGLSFPQAAATLAVVVIGIQLDLVTPETADAIIMVIFATCLIGPLVTNAAAKRIRQPVQAAEVHGARIPGPGEGNPDA
jgi:Kef-type K+ transport system membrane component KefB